MRIFLVFIAVIAVAYLVHRNHEVERIAEDNQRKIQQLEQKLNESESKSQLDRNNIEGEIASTKAEIVRKQKELDSINSQLADARSYDDHGRVTTTIEFDIKRQKEKISNLEEQIRLQEFGKAAVAQGGQAMNAQIDAEKRQEEVAIDGQIDEANGKLHDMTNLSNELKAQKFNLTAQQQYKDILPQIVLQKAIIEDLKVKKKNAGAQFQIKKSQNNLGKIESRKSYDENLLALKTQLKEEKQSLEGLTQQMSKTRGDLKSKSELASQLNQRKQDVQSNINQLNHHLQELMGKKGSL